MSFHKGRNPARYPFVRKIATNSHSFAFSLFIILILVARAAAYDSWNSAFGISPFDGSGGGVFTPSFTTSVTDFENFGVGTVHGQFGWRSLGSNGSGCAVYDHQVAVNAGAPASFGTKSLRLSNAVTSGCFTDQTFSATLPNEAGETSAENGGWSGGIRQKRFFTEWNFISATPGAEQPGLMIGASADRGDGARMTLLRMVDTPGGIDLVFFDYQRSVANFVATNVATGLDRSVVHNVRMEIDFFDGPANDVVRIYVDGALRHTGTTWEDYFRDQEGNPTRTVSTVLFRSSGTAAPATAGNGFLIDGLTTGSSSPTASVSSPFDARGWFFFNEGANGSGSYVSGPATPPVGFGSARLTVDGTGRHNLATLGYAGTRFDQITQLAYSSYQNNNSSAVAAISLQFGMDYDLSDSSSAFQGRLVYEPYVNSTVQQGVWQTWNPLAGRFWATRAPFNATCPQSNPCTWQQVLAAWPNAGISADTANGLGVVIFRAGGPVAGGFDGNVDNFTVGVGSNATTWNFEPLNTIVVDDDGQASATSCDDPVPASTSVAAAVSVANAGDTIRVCPGTYPTASTINLDKQNLTVVGVGPARPILQVAQAAGSLFFVTASGVTLDNLEIQKTDLAGEHNLVRVQANGFTAKNNLIYGPDPGMTWNAAGIVSRAFVISANSGITIQNNVIRNLRQPAYMSGNNSTGGVISGNNVSGTKGWVVEGGAWSFTANTFGDPQNQDCDIALLASSDPVNFSPLLGLSTANDNAFICAQYAGGDFGRATAYVSSVAPAGGNGSDSANYNSINAAVAGTLAGGVVQVASGGYNEDVTVGKSVSIVGAGASTTTVTGVIGGDPATFRVNASNVEIRGFKITRAGNTVAQWNDPGLNTVGVAVQGQTFTGLNLHDNLLTGNRSAIDINNSNGHTVRNNVITDNRTGIIFRNQTDNMTVVENEITNNWTVGILFIDGSGGSNSPVQSAANSTFANNAISGNWYGQVVDRQSGGSIPAPGTTLKNFGGNWLGTTNPVLTTSNSTEPGYAAQIPVAFGGTATAPGGQPDIAGPASANLDFSPFLGTGIDTNVETTAGRGTFGFQGGRSSVFVSAASPQANAGLSNIQEGINLVNAGGSLGIQNGTYPGNVDVNKQLTLSGTPTIAGTLRVSAAGARLSPGFSPGIITSGDLSLTPGTFVDIELNGTTAGTGYDQLRVNGTVDLGGATLNLTTGFSPANGSSFTIVDNDGGDPVTGTFAGLPDGTVFFIGSTSFRINYSGGTGNDVVLTAVNLCNTVSIPTNVSTRTGQTVTLPVNVDNTTGNGLLSFDMRLTYDPAVINAPTVSLTSITAGSVLSANLSTPGVIVVSVFRATPFSGSGSLLDISFNTVGGVGTTSGVNFASFAFNEGTPCLSTSNGSVRVIGGTVAGAVTYANSTTIKPVPNTTLSGSGSVGVSTQTDLSGNYTLSGFGAGAYTVTPTKSSDVTNISPFDSALIAQYVIGLTSLTPTQQMAADVSENGILTSFDAALIARFIVLLPNSGTTGQWRFTPTNRSYPGVTTDLTGQDYTAVLKGEVSGDWAPPTSFAATAMELQLPPDEERVPIIAKDVVAAPGGNVVVPLNIANADGRGVVAYQFDIVFDPNVIAPVAPIADIGETVSSGMIVTANRVAENRMRVAVFGAYPIQGEGSLVKLLFSAVGGEGQSSSVRFENVILNENRQLAKTTDGTVRLSGLGGPSITGRLITSTGEPIGREKVVLRSSGGTRLATTSADGSFRFTGLAVGETYTVSSKSRRYQFDPIVVVAVDGATEVQLIARP